MKVFHSSVLFLLLFFVSCERQTPSDHSLSKVNATYEKACNYRDQGKVDSAYYFYAIAKDAYIKNKDSLRIAKSLINMAIIQTDKGDHFGGIETSLEADKFLKKNDSLTKEMKSSNFNNLAIASSEIKDEKNAEKYYNLALENTQNKEAKYDYFNNLGNVFLTAKNYSKAKDYFKKALKTPNKTSYARAINNWGRCLYSENVSANVLPYFLKALKIRTEENDEWGLNSSYSAIADFYLKREPKKAIYYSNKMLSIATKINSADDRLEALQKLILLESPEKSRQHFHTYQKLSDSLQTVRAKAKNQFALIRYEAEKKESENQQLKAEAAQKENKLLRQNVLVALLLVGILILIFWFRQRRRHMAQQAEIKIKNTELKYSKKVHDVVANGIYRVLNEVENNEHLNREKLLDNLENIYEKSRDISYEPLSISGNFFEELNGLISSYSSEQLKIIIINEAALWKDMAPEIQTEVKLIIQELLVNLKKHSKANFSKFSFEKEGKSLNISYADNGIGLPEKGFIKMNGLHNMEKRIADLRGKIEFSGSETSGTKISIEIPC